MERKDLQYFGRSKGAKKHIRRVLAESRKEEALKPGHIKLPDRYEQVQKELQNPNLKPQVKVELQFEEMLWGLKLENADSLTIKNKGMEFYDQLSKDNPAAYQELVDMKIPGPNNRLISRAIQIHNRVYPPIPKKYP